MNFFLTYSWKDEKIANEIEDKFTDKRISIKRDKINIVDLQYKCNTKNKKVTQEAKSSIMGVDRPPEYGG